MSESLRNLLAGLTTALFAVNLIHSFMYLPAADRHEGGEHMPHGVYYACLVAFYFAMMFALFAPSLPLMWVAVELTTLVSAPLIAYRRTKESLEAMWKYLLICSIGIGLALFGTMLVLHAQTTGNLAWHKVGFAFILAGYGTKTGLAPFHTWLPDAHSEAPAPVSALLSGALLNCSFFAIVRFCDIMPEEAVPFCRGAMLALGLLSILVAAVFMVRQTDYKRLLAYSSVEHMGLATVMLAVLLGSEWEAEPGDGSIFMVIAFFAHIAFHSLTKTMLFLCAGNLLLAFGTRAIAAVQGLGSTMRGHAFLWTVGILFICGVPPSVLFFTELAFVVAAPAWVSSVALALFFIVFAAMTRVALGMSMGRPAAHPSEIQLRLAVMPVLVFLTLLFGGLCASAVAAYM